MLNEPIVPQTAAPGDGQARCPVDHAALSPRKTARADEPTEVIPIPRPAIERDAAGVWRVRGYEEARAILRGTETKQAGFRAELLERLPQQMNTPILYQEGRAHQQQRRQTARFFTPRAVSENYRELMERLAGELVAELVLSKRADLSQLSMRLAVQVAGEVVGLTESRLPGMDRRLDAFFAGDLQEPSWRPRALLGFLRTQIRMVAFYLLDVRPAIQARRRQPREDVISHLLAQGYRDSEILTECVTYGAAGMATTREFICVAAWHLLEQPALRARYLAAPEEERQAILQEMLRVEPVVGHLYRRATADLQLASTGQSVTIPAGDLIDVQIHAANADPAVVGEEPLAVCPGRALRREGVSPVVLGFGDGHHRCPGAYVALQETDIFLRRLLALEGLRLERAPTVRWSELVTGYELRDFLVALG